MGYVIQVCSMHWLRDLVISYSLFCAMSHCVWVRCSFCSNCMRFSISRFCLSRKMVCRFCKLLGDMGYMSRGVYVGVVVILTTMVFGVSCSWTG